MEELSSTRPRLLTERWRGLDLRRQVSTAGSLNPQREIQQRQEDTDQSAAALLKTTPTQVTSSQRLKTRWWVKRDWMSISALWGADTGPEYFTGGHSNDSDISDQEQGNTHSHWASSIQMDLRPELFDMDPDHILSREATETSQVYAEVLPGPLKWLHLTRSLSSPDKGEERAGPTLHAQDASISAIVSRLIELERLQAATVLKERVRTGRSRPATAVPVTRCCSRQRKPDPVDPRSEFSGTRECRSAVSVSTDVAPSDSAPVTHRMTASGVQTKRRKAKTGPKHRPVPSNRPHSCPVRSAEKLEPGPSTGSSTSPTLTSLNKSKHRKATKKEISRRGHTGCTIVHKSKG